MNFKRGVVYMSKDRVVSFTDAILAIVMTILVLGLREPETPTLAAFWELRESYFAYALSFFWLGMLWMTFNNVFEMVRKVDNQVIFSTVIMLFICSLVPYATQLGAEYFHTRIIQILYGALIISANFSIYWMYHTLIRADPKNLALKCYIQDLQKMMHLTIAIKVAGMAIAWFWYPPFMMDSIIFAAVFAGIYKAFNDRRIASEIDEYKCSESLPEHPDEMQVQEARAAALESEKEIF